jgi:hypothetical protein
MLGSGYVVDYVPIQYFDRVGKRRSGRSPIRWFLQLISRIALFRTAEVFLPLSGLLLLMALPGQARSWPSAESLMQAPPLSLQPASSWRRSDLAELIWTPGFRQGRNRGRFLSPATGQRPKF